MGELIKLTGIVLSASNIGEYDKRVVILTKERGKIAAFARGARRMGSPYTAACQSFAYGVFTVFEGKNYNLNGVEIEDYFPEIRENLNLLYRGLYFCEMADYFTVEGNDELEILKLLYVSLNALRKGVMQEQLIQVVFEIKILAYFGLMMETSQCACCGRHKELTSAGEKADGTEHEGTPLPRLLTHFQSGQGGVICSVCAQKLSHVIAIQESTLYTLQYILSQPVTKLYHFKVTSAVLEELKKVSRDYLQTHVNHAFKALEFVTMLE